MSETIGLFNSYYAGPASPSFREESSPKPSRASGERASMVETTATAPSSFRRAWLAAIRRQVRDGVFDTPERLEGTIDRLLPLVR